MVNPTTPKNLYPVYSQALSVPFRYPVHFTRNLFADDNPILSEIMSRPGSGRIPKAAVFVDAGVHEADPLLIPRILEYFRSRADRMELALAPEVVPGGEPVKAGWKAVHGMVEAIAGARLDRHSFVLAVGGGSVLDVTGFAAAMVHRGLRLVRVPTTTLSQCDAGVGVKNGINACGQKNFLGAFAPPFAVVNDFDLLSTLLFRDWIAGVSEAFKVSLIRDRAFFDFLCDHAQALGNRDPDVMERLIYRCAVLHLDHIRENGDPFEFGSARPLDFGHWAAHKIENMSDYTVGHGHAVAVGIALDSCYAWKTGLMDEKSLERIVSGLSRCGLPIWHDLLCRPKPGAGPEVLDGIEDFREHLGGELTITLPRGIGDKVEVNRMDAAVLEEAIHWLKARTHPCP